MAPLRPKRITRRIDPAPANARGCTGRRGCSRHRQIHGAAAPSFAAGATAMARVLAFSAYLYSFQ